MFIFKRPDLYICIALLGALTGGTAWAQEDLGTRLGVQRGGDLSFEPYGPGVLFDALDPTAVQRAQFVPPVLPGGVSGIPPMSPLMPVISAFFMSSWPLLSGCFPPS